MHRTPLSTFLLACFHVDESGGKGGKGRCGISRLMGRVVVVPCKTTVASDSTSESGSGIWLLRVEGTATRRWVDGAVKCFFRRRRHWPPPPPFFFPLFRSAKPRPKKLSRFLPPSSPPSRSLFIFLFSGEKRILRMRTGALLPLPVSRRRPNLLDWFSIAGSSSRRHRTPSVTREGGSSRGLLEMEDVSRGKTGA